MRRWWTYVVTFLFCFSALAQVEQKEVLLLMGSRFEITVVAQDAKRASQGILLAIEEIKRIEALISSWDPKSQTSLINKNAGLQPVIVDSELYDLIVRSKSISELTHGAYDISAMAVGDLWHFDGSMQALPSTEAIAALKPKINYHHILLNPQEHSVLLKEKGMRIGFGSIGKGYAAQKASDLLQKQGYMSGLINAGGDLYAWGKQPSGEYWQVGITDPKSKDKAKSWLALKDQAIVTSGDYEKQVQIAGQYYSHIIDPRTAMPVDNNLKSVSVIASNAELADALATALFVLGSKTGLYLVNQLSQVEALFIDRDGGMVYSDNVFLNKVER